MNSCVTNALHLSTPGVVHVDVNGRTFTSEGEVGLDRYLDVTVDARDLNSWDNGLAFVAGEKDYLVRNLDLAA